MKDLLGIAGVTFGGRAYVLRRDFHPAAIRERELLVKMRTGVRMASFALAVASVLYAGWVVSASMRPGLLASVDDVVPVLPFLSIAAVALMYTVYLGDRLTHRTVNISTLGAARSIVVDPQKGLDSAVLFDETALRVFERAVLIAEKHGQARVGLLHVAAAFFELQSGRVLLARLGVTASDMAPIFLRALSKEMPGKAEDRELLPKVAAEAIVAASAARRSAVHALDVFAVAFQKSQVLQDALLDRGYAAPAVMNAVQWVHWTEDMRSRLLALRRAAAYKPAGNMDRAMTARATPFLDAFSEDVTRAAVYGKTGLLVGRDHEVAAVFRAIEGGGRSVVLVGDEGVGKRTIIDGIADLMVEERVPAILKDKRLVRLSLARIIGSGGGASERLQEILTEVALSGNIVLVIDDVHELLSPQAGSLALELARELEKGYTFAICTTTPQMYVRFIEGSSLVKILTKVPIVDPEGEDLIRILAAAALMVESRHGVVFNYGALQAAAELSARYARSTAMPHAAIAVMQEAAQMVKSQQGTWVTKQEIVKILEEKTNIKLDVASRDEAATLLVLEQEIHERVIGQEMAVKAIASALRRARAELRASNRPIASFLFLGPTGVGKTELAKATAASYFGAEDTMLRFDMSEYTAPDAVARLVGSAGNPGTLTEAVRQRPFALVLLDEFEKAHSDVHNLFLQVMDDGRLTDGLGRTIDFTNTIIIATSNASSQTIQDEIRAGKEVDDVKTMLMSDALRATFRPELLNRFTDVIVFAPLTKSDIVAIAYLLVDQVAKRLQEKGIGLEVTDAAIHEFADDGYDPVFGARPLRRLIEENLENALADAMLRGDLSRRDTAVYDVGGKLSVKKAEALA